MIAAPLVQWRDREQSFPRILVVDGALTGHEIDSETMRSADVVACVADDIVRVVKDRDGVSRNLTPDQWMKLVESRMKGRRHAQVIQVDLEQVRR